MGGARERRVGRRLVAGLGIDAQVGAVLLARRSARPVPAPRRDRATAGSGSVGHLDQLGGIHRLRQRFRDDNRDRLADIAHRVLRPAPGAARGRTPSRRGFSAALRAGWSAPGCAGSGAARPLPRRRRSAPRAPPAAASAAAASIATIAACACGERTIAGMDLARQAEIRGVPPPSGQQPDILAPRHRFPDAPGRQRVTRFQKGHDPPPPPRARWCSRARVAGSATPPNRAS